MLTILATLALAEDLPALDAQLWRPPIDARDTMWAEDASVGETGALRFRAALGMSAGAMGARHGDELVQVLDQVWVTDVVAGAHLGPVRLGVHAPFVLRALSDVAPGETGLGDLGLDLKATALDPARTRSGTGLALLLRGTAPTSSLALPLASPGPTWEATAVFDQETSFGRLVLNLGHRGAPPVSVANLDLDDAFVFRAGAGTRFRDDLGASMEIGGRVHYGKRSDVAGVPVEGLFGLWAHLDDDVWIRFGVGTGLTPGVGASVARGVAMVSWEPSIRLVRDLDLDGVADRDDACIDDPEDLDGRDDEDGCPDPDDDADGIADIVDACPLEPEDFDGLLDGDGCPEPATWLTVRVESMAGLPLPGVAYLVDGDDDFGVSGGRYPVEPGPHEVAVRTDELVSDPVAVTVTADTPLEAVVHARPAEGRSLLGLRAQNAAGEAVDVKWSIDGKGWVEAPGGAGVAVLAPGRHTVTVDGFGWAQQGVPVDLDPNDESKLVVTMRPAWGTLMLRVVDTTGRPVAATWAAGGFDPAPVAGSAEGWLQEGDHLLVVEAPGYQRFERKIEVRRDVATEITVKLVHAP